MKDNGIIIKNMDLELSISIPMLKNTRENFRMERNMEKGFTISAMETDTKANFGKEIKMEKESYCTYQVRFTREIGRKTK
jgi:hypothetical protein